MSKNVVQRAWISICCVACVFIAALGEEPNKWVQIEGSQLGPGFSPGLVWAPNVRRFVFFAGGISHHFKGERPYDVMSFDPASRKWRNELPAGAEARGSETGMVRDVDYKTPYFAMEDLEGFVRPNRRHMTMYYHYTLAPWDNRVYALICGHTLSYDPATRTWKDLKPAASPVPEVGTARTGLSWASLCADPVNREVVLFGGCGLTTPNGSPGTWVYSPDRNEWRKLELKTEPPPRALSPMVFDPTTEKIVLFGGDGLDRLYADTWIYDCKTRLWEERKPAVSPSPRFGHGFVFLPQSRSVVLVGGKGYTSSLSYCAVLYRALPFEVWKYDVGRNEWTLIQHLEAEGPPQAPTEAACVAVDDNDAVLFIGGKPTGSVEKGTVHTAWLCRLDITRTDRGITGKYGAGLGTIEYRTGPYDPEWYTSDVPQPDAAAAESFLANVPPNRWVSLNPPKRPKNRMGGGWSTVTLDTDHDQILHMGGGHSSYFGNDVAHYDIKTDRWTISYRPQFALDFNYDLNGPGLWAFNGAPWGNHNYHAYAYDPTIGRVVYIKTSMTLFYDPVKRSWPHEEKFGNLPFYVSKYVNYLCSTPHGVVCWTQTSYGSSKTGLWRLEMGKRWVELKTSGDPLPMTVCDGSTISYDSKRDRLLFTTTPDRGAEPVGQVWACALKTGEVRKLNPGGSDAIRVERFARESAYLASADMVLVGYVLELGGRLVMPLYDCEENQWVVAEFPGSDFVSKGKPGTSVDLGLVYDAKRDLVWGVLCNLGAPNSLNVMRVVRGGLTRVALKAEG
ncbi:MAG: hypothetical protein N2255_09625 [Kiritimatiellae bacterium]|nr:hypothetical protein [Kiritimatiellia bacterium]